MSVIGAAPLAARSIPGSRATSADPGENPSLRLSSVGSMWTPAALAGVASAARSTRRPVSAERSRTGEVVVGERQETAPHPEGRSCWDRSAGPPRSSRRRDSAPRLGLGRAVARRCRHRRRGCASAAIRPAVSATSVRRARPLPSDDHRYPPCTTTDTEPYLMSLAAPPGRPRHALRVGEAPPEPPPLTIPRLLARGLALRCPVCGGGPVPTLVHHARAVPPLRLPARADRGTLDRRPGHQHDRHLWRRSWPPSSPGSSPPIRRPDGPGDRRHGGDGHHRPAGVLPRVQDPVERHRPGHAPAGARRRRRPAVDPAGPAITAEAERIGPSGHRTVRDLQREPRPHSSASGALTTVSQDDVLRAFLGPRGCG